MNKPHLVKAVQYSELHPIRAQDVITVFEAAFVRFGRPRHLRSDNGLEFIAYAIQDRLDATQIKTLYIQAGSPWENGHIESFHDKLRGECLTGNSLTACSKRRSSLKRGAPSTMTSVPTACCAAIHLDRRIRLPVF